MDNAFKKHLFSTSDPLHPIRHELGHVAHDKFGRLTEREFESKEHIEIAEKVSRRAAKEPSYGLVAEVYAGMGGGKEHSQDVMKPYRRYFGRKE